MKNRVSLIGWSNGGIASLWAVRPRAMPRDGQPDFRSVVAFYPGCRRLSNVAWSARIPTLLLVGRADDWTPAAVCEQMVAAARGRTAKTEIVVYPGAYHEFDRPDYPVRVADRDGLQRRRLRPRACRHQRVRARRLDQARDRVAGAVGRVLISARCLLRRESALSLLRLSSATMARTRS